MLSSFFSQAQEENVQLVVLPENFAYMGIKDTDKFQIAEEFGEGLIQKTLSNLPREYGIWVVAGTIPLRTSGERVRSACLVFEKEGKCMARYDKIHLFDVRVSEMEAHKESATIERGEEIVVVDTPVGKIGLSICYDLRFPELFQQMTAKGAEIFTVPSAFTAVTGAAHWEVLLRARAIENLAYVLAPIQGGQHENGRQTHSHSMIVEPWGNVVGETGLGTGMVIVDIDLQRLRQLRKQFPSNEHHILGSVENSLSQ